MKTKLQLFAVVVIAAVATLFAQGPLTPPGAPAPMMKTLDQIEARKPITGPGAGTISVSGSYYLTTNIAVIAGNAITITADNVTLDLNGFTLSSTEASPNGTGVLLSGDRKHIHILNGHIQGNVSYSAGTYGGSGFAYGVRSSGGSFLRNARVTGVSVSGCLQDGINIQGSISSVAESCTVQTVGGSGIVAGSVSHSTAKQCGLTGITASVASDCLGESTGNSPGVGALHAHNCTGLSSGSGHGVNATTAQNCAGTSFSTGNGVSANVAQSCYGTSFGSGNGVKAETAENCAGSSTTGAGNGVDADTATNCKGYSGGSGHGVYARTAQNCHGQANSGFGIDAEVATSCNGTSSTSVGVRSLGTASNCYGVSAGDGIGVSVRYTASNCVGSSQSGAGVQAGVALNCIGVSESGGTGVVAGNVFTGNGIAQNCLGVTTGTGVSATIAIGCYGGVTANPRVSTFKQYFCGTGPNPYP